ncbi:MAG: transposase [Candidatus Anaerobiospirillum merdipullorum]|uniref:Transposase n=1 Tax=Candidatus Anaerobiospirillum merdipullorum TaxID=2838450 RepID=A0A9E2NRV4_9GAMM|nr:transposase [Candidatus Anaerobiospirillum merdipullorum]
MNAPELPSLLMNRSGKFFYLYTYKNEWDPIKKRSKRAAGSTKKAGQLIEPNQKTGPIKWEPDFIKQFPDLDKLDAVRNGKGKITFTLKEEPELDEEQPVVRIKEAMKLERKHAGAVWVLEQIIADTPLSQALHRVFGKFNVDRKILSLAFFMVLEHENSMSLYAPFAQKTRLPWAAPLTDGAITRIFQSISADKIDRFLQELNRLTIEHEEANPNFRPKYWALDSTSISTYSRKLTKAAWGKNKDGDPLKQINVLMVVDQHTGAPMYYRSYTGNIPDVFTVKHMLQEACRIKLDSNAVYVADRGYGSIKNIHRFFQAKANFLFNISTRLSMCKALLAENLQQLTDPKTYRSALDGNNCVTCECEWSYPVNFRTNCQHRVPKLKEKVFVHLYYNKRIRIEEENNLSANLEKVFTNLLLGKELDETLTALRDTYMLYNPEKQEWNVNLKVFHEYLLLKGLRVLISNTVKDPEEAYRAYYDRNEVEKAFNQYKDTLGFRRLRSSEDRSHAGRQFVQFIATSIAIMFRKRLANAKERGLKAYYDSDALLLKKLNQIECSTFNDGTYYTEITSKMAEVFNALEVPAPDDEVSNGTTATDLDEELSIVDDLIDNEPDYDVKDDIDSLQ